MSNSWFRFKQFAIQQEHCAHKVGTDGVLLGAWATHPNPKYILDIGSGSGLISLMLAQRFPNAQIIGVELDKNSFEQSVENLQRSPFSERISMIHGDFLDIEFQKKFDLIVSNPPFFKNAYLSGQTNRDKARHEFSLPHVEMMQKALSLISPHGNISLILPVDEALAINKENIGMPFYINNRTWVSDKKMTEPKRILLELSLENKKLEEAYLTLKNEDNSRSTKYIELTKDFYL